jgi:hypothetical protein
MMSLSIRNQEITKEGNTPMTKFYLRYIRYILTHLSVVGFGRLIN